MPAERQHAVRARERAACWIYRPQRTHQLDLPRHRSHPCGHHSRPDPRSPRTRQHELRAAVQRFAWRRTRSRAHLPSVPGAREARYAGCTQSLAHVEEPDRVHVPARSLAHAHGHGATLAARHHHLPERQAPLHRAARSHGHHAPAVRTHRVLRTQYQVRRPWAYCYAFGRSTAYHDAHQDQRAAYCEGAQGTQVLDGHGQDDRARGAEEVRRGNPYRVEGRKGFRLSESQRW